MRMRLPTGTSRVDPFLLLLRAVGLPAPVLEHRFALPRQWRADYCWLAPYWLIVEREGGITRGGRGGGTALGGHSSVTGIRRDIEKSNAAQLAGYRYLRFLPRELDSGAALPTIRRALDQRAHREAERQE